MRHSDSEAQELACWGFSYLRNLAMILNAFWALFAGGRFESPHNLVSLSGFVFAGCLGYIKIGNLLSKMYFLGMLTHTNSVRSGG